MKPPDSPPLRHSKAEDALAMAPLLQVALSVVGAVVLNLTLAIKHRAGRYIAN